MSLGIIHPIYPKGDGVCMTKLLAMILDDRIHTRAEGEGLRAYGQAGFRRDHRTVDNTFVLRTLIEHCTEAGRPSERKSFIHALLTSRRLLPRCLMTCSGRCFRKPGCDIRCFIATSPYTMLTQPRFTPRPACPTPFSAQLVSSKAAP